MYMSLKDRCAKGFGRWADAYQLEIKNDLSRAGAADRSAQVVIKTVR
jgi:hypothetical protein